MNKLNSEDRFYKDIPEPFLKPKVKNLGFDIIYHHYGQRVRAL